MFTPKQVRGLLLSESRKGELHTTANFMQKLDGNVSIFTIKFTHKSYLCGLCSFNFLVASGGRYDVKRNRDL